MTLTVGALSIGGRPTRVVPARGVPPQKTYSSNEKEHSLSTDDFISVRPLEPRVARSPDAAANARGSRWICITSPNGRSASIRVGRNPGRSTGEASTCECEEGRSSPIAEMMKGANP